ncbi:MAG: FadR/GntR family transcriptional regulator [Anaerolineales bacterium]
MTPQLPVRQPSLVQLVVKTLSEQIHKGSYPPSSRLPPENELAKRLKVSRATVRSVLVINLPRIFTL